MPDAPNAGRPRVLVADPDPEITALLARQLEWAGYDVSTAANGREALDLVTRLRPAALVLEVKMELMTGYEVVRTLREDPRNRLMPVVMISARAGKLDRDFAFTVGADEYVKKPFLTSDLVAKLTLLAPSGTDSPEPVDTPKPQPQAQPIATRRRQTLRPVPALAAR